MLRKIGYIIIFWLCLLKTQAQRMQDVEGLISKIKIAVNAHGFDSQVSQTCRQRINALQNSLAPTPLKLNDISFVQKLIKADSSFLLFANSDSAHGCKTTNPKFKNIVDSANHLFTALNKLKDSLKSVHEAAVNTDASPSNKPPLTLIIKMIDDSTQETINGNINIKDSSGSVFKNTDSDYFGLYRGIKYSIEADAKEYDTVTIDTEFTATATVDSLNILMKHKSSLSKPPLNTDDKMLLLLIAVSVLFIITLIALILSMKKCKDLRLTITKISDLPNVIKLNQQNMEENNNNTTVPQTIETAAVIDPAEIIPQATEITSVERQDEPVINQPNINAYFICELMMTAGPRKDDFEDIDLGEDVCGCISNSNETMVWILDGTSDADRLWRRHHNLPPTDENVLLKDRNEREYFSSRLLAQCIANKLRKNFVEKNAGPSKELIHHIINEVKEDWQKTIDELSADDKKDLEETVRGKISINCSTTLLMAKLSIDGKLTAYRCGDSRMLLFENTKENKIALLEKRFEEKNEEKNDRLFFSFQLNKSDNSIGFFSNNDKLEPEIISEENINAIISFSDGIGFKTQQYLKEEYKNNPGIVKKEIINQRQGTQDDKSICFIEVKQTAGSEIE